MARRGKCRCGNLLEFKLTAVGYKTRCSNCHAVVRLREEAFSSDSATVAVPKLAKPRSKPKPPPVPVSVVAPDKADLDFDVELIANNPSPGEDDFATIDEEESSQPVIIPEAAPQPHAPARRPTEFRDSPEGIPLWVFGLCVILIVIGLIAAVVFLS
jgi:hypothetical protein